jgi:hypothetical protein
LRKVFENRFKEKRALFKMPQFQIRESASGGTIYYKKVLDSRVLPCVYVYTERDETVCQPREASTDVAEEEQTFCDYGFDSDLGNWDSCGYVHN